MIRPPQNDVLSLDPPPGGMAGGWTGGHDSQKFVVGCPTLPEKEVNPEDFTCVQRAWIFFASLDETGVEDFEEKKCHHERRRLSSTATPGQSHLFASCGCRHAHGEEERIRLERMELAACCCILRLDFAGAVRGADRLDAAMPDLRSGKPGQDSYPGHSDALKREGHSHHPRRTARVRHVGNGAIQPHRPDDSRHHAPLCLYGEFQKKPKPSRKPPNMQRDPSPEERKPFNKSISHLSKPSRSLKSATAIPHRAASTTGPRPLQSFSCRGASRLPEMAARSSSPTGQTIGSGCTAQRTTR